MSSWYAWNLKLDLLLHSTTYLLYIQLCINLLLDVFITLILCKDIKCSVSYFKAVLSMRLYGTRENIYMCLMWVNICASLQPPQTRYMF